MDLVFRAPIPQAVENNNRVRDPNTRLLPQSQLLRLTRLWAPPRESQYCSLVAFVVLIANAARFSIADLPIIVPEVELT